MMYEDKDWIDYEGVTGLIVEDLGDGDFQGSCRVSVSRCL